MEKSKWSKWMQCQWTDFCLKSLYETLVSQLFITIQVVFLYAHEWLNFSYIFNKFLCFNIYIKLRLEYKTGSFLTNASWKLLFLYFYLTSSHLLLNYLQKHPPNFCMCENFLFADSSDWLDFNDQQNDWVLNKMTSHLLMMTWAKYATFSNVSVS